MKGDKGIMALIIAGGVGAVAGALFVLAKQQASPVAALQGTGAVISWQPNRRRLTGWGTPGFGGGFGRAGTGAAIYWRQVA